MKSHKSSRTFSLTKLLSLSLALTAVGLSTQSVRASNWVGDTSSDWNNAANWSSDPANPTGDFIINNTAGPGIFPVISANSLFTPVDIRIGTGSTGRVDHIAGTAGTGNGNWMFLGYSGATATYNLADTGTSGGTFTGFGQGSGSLNVGGASQNGNALIGLDSGTVSTWNINTSGTVAAAGIYLGSAGASQGRLNMDNGTVNLSGEFQIGGDFFGQGASNSSFNMSGGTFTANSIVLSRGDNNGSVMTGTANITGGTLNSRTWFTLGFAGSSSASASVTNSGGTINVNTSGGGNMEMTVFDPMSSHFVQNSGALNLNNSAYVSFGNGGNNSGTSTFDHNNGTVTFYSDLATTVGGTGYLSLGQGGDTGTYTYNLNGGTLTVPKIQRTASGGSGTFNFNGGTLKAAGSSTTFMQGLTAANVQAGGAIVDTNSFNITIGQALLNGGGGGGLTKNGSGKLTLGGASTYTGATNVNVGTLAVGASGSISASTNVNIADVATFDTTAQSFTMLGSQTFKFTLNPAGAGSAGLLNAAALDITSGTVDFATIGTLDDSAYVIADYSSLAGAAFSSVSNLPSGYSIDYGYNGGTQVALVVPEPATFAMLAFGTATLLAFRRHKRSL